MFAEVSLPISSFKTFTYLVPENLETQSLIGSRVTVPFGNRKVSGVIVSLMDSTSFSGEVKSISSFDDDAPIILNWIDFKLDPFLTVLDEWFDVIGLDGRCLCT